MLLERDDEIAMVVAIMRGHDYRSVEELLADMLRRPAWHADAACRSRAGFFELDLDDAIAICEGCPVRAPCAWFGLEREETGVWGGTTDRQRERCRTEGWTLQQLLDSDPEPDRPCAYCGRATDTRGRCKNCGSKRAVRSRAEAFRREQERRRSRGEKPLPPWAVESRPGHWTTNAAARR